MKQRFVRPLLASFLFLGAALRPGSASAQDAASSEPSSEKVACSQAFEEAQRQQNEAHYLAANQSLLKCANPTCGDALFRECSKLYAELQEAMPSVVFAAKDGATGNELTDVKVTIDGQPAAERLDGRPLPIDPGNHTFTFTLEGKPPIERQLTIRAGEKFRPVSIVIGEAAPAPTAAPPLQATPMTTPPAEPERRRSVPAISYVLAGVGVVAAGGFVAFRLIGSGDYSDLKESCARPCPDSQIDPVKTKYYLSYASLGLSALALTGAVVFYLVQPGDSGERAPALVVSPHYDGVAARVVTRF